MRIVKTVTREAEVVDDVLYNKLFNETLWDERAARLWPRRKLTRWYKAHAKMGH